MSSATTVSYLSQMQQLVTDNPYYAGAAAVTAALGLGVAGYKWLNRKQDNGPAPQNAAERDMAAKQKRVKDVLDKLLITEYHLPAKKGEKSNWTATNKPQPIFNDETKKEIQKVAEMIKKAIDSQAPLPNLILKGPAGVGKTMLGEDLCHRTGIGFIRIPSGAMEKHIKTGNHIHAFRDVVKVAEECPVPTYIIMDDGEELIAQRPDAKKAEAKSDVKASWLVEQERLSDTITQRRTALVNAILEESGKSYRKFGFCITTNRFDVIDSAFGTRARIIHIDAPSIEERKHIIITHLPTIFKFDNDILSFFHKGRLEDMAVKTEGFTGRNIVKMLEDIYACVQLDEGNITQDTIDSSILAMKASVERAKGPSVTSSVRQLFRSIASALSF